MFQEHEYCRSCGFGFPSDQLSNRGLCADCAKERLLESIQQLQEHDGWIWERWLRSYIAAMSGVLNRLEKELRENDIPF